jgi:hypothetical protein
MTTVLQIAVHLIFNIELESPFHSKLVCINLQISNEVAGNCLCTLPQPISIDCSAITPGETGTATEVFMDLATSKSENHQCACAVLETSKELSGKDRFSLFWKSMKTSVADQARKTTPKE